MSGKTSITNKISWKEVFVVINVVAPSIKRWWVEMFVSVVDGGRNCVAVLLWLSDLNNIFRRGFPRLNWIYWCTLIIMLTINQRFEVKYLGASFAHMYQKNSESQTRDGNQQCLNVWMIRTTFVFMCRLTSDLLSCCHMSYVIIHMVCVKCLCRSLGHSKQLFF